MTATPPGAYVQQSNALGSFTIYNDGGVQGVQLDDPATRFALRSGVVSTAETVPLYGGIGIYEFIPSGLSIVSPLSPDGALQSTIGRATSITGGANNLSGFTVFNQAYNMVGTAASPVPVAGSSMTMNYVRLGSGARVQLAIDAALTSLEGGLVGQQVSWDFGGQQIVPYAAAYVAATPSVYNSYTSSTGILQLTFSAAPGPLAGNSITLTGFVGAQAVFNGTWYVATTASAGTVLNIQTTPGLGTISLSGAVGTLVAGGGALPVTINRIRPANGMIVNNSYAATGTFTWNRNGAVADVQI